MATLKVLHDGERFDALSVSMGEGDGPEQYKAREMEPVSTVPRLALREVLLHALKGGPTGTTPADLRRQNEHLLDVLDACHRADTARRQLLNTLNTQSTLEDVANVLSARVEAGLSAPQDEHRLDLLLEDLRCSVAQASAAWDAASRHFTRRTRLFPSHLDAIAPGFAPVDRTEIERMAQISQVTCPDTLESLRALARERIRQPMDRSTAAGDGAVRLDACMTRLHEVRAHAIREFSAARAAYWQAVADVGLAKGGADRARDRRQEVEAGFRIGTRDALAFAQAILEQNRHCNNLLMRESMACVARHTLYALARRLPDQFDLR